MSQWGTREWFEREFRGAESESDPWGHEWRASQRERHTRLARLAAPLLDGGGCAVVDVGCSYGALTARLSALNPGGCVVGLDLSERAVRVARRRIPSARFAVGALPACALAPEHFDLALAAEVIYYLPGPAREAAIIAIRRALLPGGRLVFSNVLDDGTRYFTTDSAQSLLSPHFRIERVEYGHDRWYSRWETPWLDLERRLSRGARIVTDDDELAEWQSEHAQSAKARWLIRARNNSHTRAILVASLRSARAVVRRLLGWAFPVRALAFIARRLGRGQSDIAIVARRVD